MVRSVRERLLLVSAAAALWVVSARPWVLGAMPSAAPWQAPELPHQQSRDWINSEPLTLDDLRGQVVLVDFWTRECWNCRQSLPWLKSLRARYGDQGLRLIGVHTPELRYERGRDGVERYIERQDVQRPVMMDNDFSYWTAMNNRYWPTFYLIDKSGRVRQRVIGEVSPGDARAARIRDKIERLLSETL